MARITDHRVEGDALNSKLWIETVGDPGPGGAFHSFMIFPEGDGAPFDIDFQHGNPAEGINGITDQALLAIILHRLRAFQASGFQCPETSFAILHAQQALNWLKARTRQRISRGVEGTHSL